MLALILNGTDRSEETVALVDLVENGANLLRAVDCLLRDIHTLSGFSGECTLIVRIMLCIEVPTYYVHIVNPPFVQYHIPYFCVYTVSHVLVCC